MKKILQLGVFVSVLVLAGCNFKPGTSTNNDGSNYEGKLVIQGVGPEISMEPTVEEGTLVLRGSFEDHTDHVFLKKGVRESLFESESEYLPGNTVELKGYVQPLDAAAGNHYYDVVNVNELKVVSYPDIDWIKDILESYSYCETDDDCTYTMGECPLGCYIAYNKQFGEIPSKIMDNYFEINGKSCIYDCIYMDKVICESYRCTMPVLENGAKEDLDEHSNNTLIISMVEGTDKSMIDKYLLKKYNLEILYEYENFNTIAVKFDNKMTEEDLDKTISEIEKIGFVIGVEKDYISHIN